MLSTEERQIFEEGNLKLKGENLDLNSKRKRKKSNYKKINNQTRQKLVEMVIK
jgi:hypothetical protein